MKFQIDSKPVVVVSHPRSGTHLTIDLLRRQFSACASWKWPFEKNDRLYCNIDELNGTTCTLSEVVAHRILGRTQRPIVKTHAWVGLNVGFLPNHAGLQKPEWLEYLHSKSSWIYVYRDPRPVLCSYYLFCISAGIIEPTTPISVFIRQEDKQGRSRVEQWNEHLRQWTAQPDILILNFDNIINKTDKTIRRLAKHLGLVPLLKEPLLPKVFPNLITSRKSRLFGIQPESTAIINKTHLKWRDAFSSDDLEYIHSITHAMLTQITQKA